MEDDDREDDEQAALEKFMDTIIRSLKAKAYASIRFGVGAHMGLGGLQPNELVLLAQLAAMQRKRSVDKEGRLVWTGKDGTCGVQCKTVITSL